MPNSRCAGVYLVFVSKHFVACCSGLQGTSSIHAHRNSTGRCRAVVGALNVHARHIWICYAYSLIFPRLCMKLNCSYIEVPHETKVALLLQALDSHKTEGDSESRPAGSRLHVLHFTLCTRWKLDAYSLTAMTQVQRTG
jgi:hypothetical protein